MIVERFGDDAIEIRPADGVELLHAHAWSRGVADTIADAIASADAPGLVDVVGAYGIVVVYLDPARPGSREKSLKRAMEWLADHAATIVSARPPRRAPATHVVRVVYDGIDLEPLSELLALDVEGIARLHAAADYVVDLVGFLPGFAYLGGLPRRLHVPRLQAPRPRVDPSSVAIAGDVTGVYPVASPGGWRLIGHAVDHAPFDARREPPVLWRAGDRVKFEVADVAR
jgi:KipI family sensor histidine kinase inhibitor